MFATLVTYDTYYLYAYVCERTGFMKFDTEPHYQPWAMAKHCYNEMLDLKYPTFGLDMIERSAL